MNKLILLLVLFYSINYSLAQSDSTYLIRYPDEDIEFYNNGYINNHGDTIIRAGEYTICFNDTIMNFGAVLDTNGICWGIDVYGERIFEIYWFENGPDYLADGLFRIVKNGKIGFANANGDIVIKPQYECANFFDNGKALVTYKCELEEDGEHYLMISKDWFYIDKRGNKIKNK